MVKKTYLYHFTYHETEEELAKLFFAYLFPDQMFTPFLLSYENYDLGNWVFLHFKIEVLAQAADLTTFTKILRKLTIEDWYLETWHYNKSLSSKERVLITRKLAEALPTEGKMNDYALKLIWALIDDVWYLGIFTPNDYPYKKRIYRPHNFSTALPVRLANQLVNYLKALYPNHSYIDPAAGSGTIVIEGLKAGLDIRGYELSYPCTQMANINLTYFNLPPIIKNCDMLDTTEIYDISILDIPYGLYTPIVLAECQALIAHCKKISNILLLISTVDYRSYLESLDYSLILQIPVYKAKFKRLITLAEHFTK